MGGILLMKKLIRRISAGVVILSFLMPWFDLLLMRVSGITLMIETLKARPDFEVEALTVFAIFGVIILIGAIATVVNPGLFESVLLTTPAVFLLLMILNAGAESHENGMGIYVLVIGIVGVIGSFFVKEQGKQAPSSPVLASQGEVAATTEQPVASSNMQKFCTHCGNEVTGNHGAFCVYCGTKLNG